MENNLKNSFKAGARSIKGPALGLFIIIINILIVGIMIPMGIEFLNYPSFIVNVIGLYFIGAAIIIQYPFILAYRKYFKKNKEKNIPPKNQ